MNLNLSASLNIFKLLAKPSLCLPHATVSTFADLPIPLNKAFPAKTSGSKQADIKAVVLDKDDCFAYPEENEVFDKYKKHFELLRAAYPGRRLLIVSNTAGATSYDKDGKMASAVEKATGVIVLTHAVKKPGCGDEIMKYFRSHPETGVTSPSQVAIVGDRLATDMMLANMMGSWGVWVREGVVPHEKKSIFSRVERSVAPYLVSRGYAAPEPSNPFE
ncbi:mitochondrial PGP phosphatase [Cladorrhinum sp. PSN259]|nr:mitochondrial PGP phosphatase [Cladorrhinum sp. PSN259]